LLQAEQTLNQLLACMDGLDTNNNGIVVLAATNTCNMGALQAEQTLNQLLACMDGLDTNNNGIVAVAATDNRYK
jgi:ATP-dependent Zn protease